MVRSLRRLACVAGLLALLPGLAAAGNAQRPALPVAAPAADPNPGVRNFLLGVTALSSTDVWAVGYDCTAHCAATAETDQSLIEHWNGTAWSQLPSPDPGTGFNRLSSVSATSATDAWAVGYYCSTGCGGASEADRTLIMHWNGTAWSQVPSPNTGSSKLSAVTATSATDASAVGYYCKSGCKPLGTLALHWNGTAWSTVPSPSPGARPLSDILWGAAAAAGTTGAWAAGAYCASGCDTPSERDRNLIEHWNGTAWHKVTAPTPAHASPILYAMSADSPTDAWAAGYMNTRSTSKAMLLHWSGTAWSLVSSPHPGSASLLYGASAQSPTSAWAVGQYFRLNAGGYLPLILHWTGTAWRKVSTPIPGQEPYPEARYLASVSADSPTDAWAVGSYCTAHCVQNSETDGVLILHWNGTRWSMS